ncbi:FAD-dependent monooxygenase [Streptomyces sulfonofaciens]|uniref:FAD-dependent monooxygenase n=1 Tax=Streptomyces sulfonofaciens TaxID=68272 RepID=A0A919GQD3_9ACTN|nr:FAD-dependent monooxygenase [Streptomyces sulfonofaciens]GHH88802.1 FAD-dependent monooxygenase [Streptomyces sulfonofaciens]
MTSRARVRALVIGAGIGGLAAAATLRRVGIDAEVYERARELRPAGGALSLMSNAVLALRTLGIDLKLAENDAAVLEQLHFLTRRGKRIRTLEFKEICDRLGAPSVGLHRAELQRLLLAAAGDVPITLDAQAVGYDIAAPDGGPGEQDSGGAGVRVLFADGSEAHGDILIGADGFGSAVRRTLLGPETPYEPGYIAWVATPHVTHPAITEQYGAHYWGRGRRFGIANIGKGQVYWWGTKNMPPERARDWHGTRAEIEETYAGWAPEVEAVIRATPQEEITAFPARDRPCAERWGEGPVTLLGDAAHPMMTSLGQGAAIAIEDAVVLARHLDGAADLPAALRAYEHARRPRAQRIVSAARSLSDLEQTERLGRLIGRRLFFTFAPRSVLDRQNTEFLDYHAAVAAEVHP